MMYYSTRSTGAIPGISSAQAIKQGLATDGGLYIPESIPIVDGEFISSLLALDYSARAVRILSLFLTDYSEKELSDFCGDAYSDKAFPGGAAPLVKIHDNVYSLELWHGPTAAFKDMALQLMPRLLSGALAKTGEERTALVLVATSGDTGKAALEGYRDVERIKIKVFYPVDGVSRVQKLQMITQLGDNVDVCAIKGNFDDAQTGVKKIFSDPEAARELDSRGYFLSSANSINWGRLAPQIVYYFSAYCDLINRGTIKIGEKVNVCVPTGNFGNIFAAYTAKLMGLPVDRLICASNSNNILTDFLATGTYDRNRPFHTTISPSMDILISSNLERLLCLTGGCARVRDYMYTLSSVGSYTVERDILEKIKTDFTGYYADEEMTASAIRRTFENHGYLCDTHTSVALHCVEKYTEDTGDSRPVIVDSTASPYKFAGSVYRALTGCKPPEDYEALEALSSLTGTQIPTPLAGLNARRIRFPDVCAPQDMSGIVMRGL